MRLWKVWGVIWFQFSKNKSISIGCGKIAILPLQNTKKSPTSVEPKKKNLACCYSKLVLPKQIAINFLFISFCLMPGTHIFSFSSFSSLIFPLLYLSIFLWFVSPHPLLLLPSLWLWIVVGGKLVVVVPWVGWVWREGEDREIEMKREKKIINKWIKFNCDVKIRALM